MSEQNADNVIKNALKSDKLLAGAREVLKAVKFGNISNIVLAANCPEEIKKDIESAAAHSKTPVMLYHENSKILGAVCKKQFKVVVAGVLAK